MYINLIDNFFSDYSKTDGKNHVAGNVSTERKHPPRPLFLNGMSFVINLLLLYVFILNYN